MVPSIITPEEMYAAEQAVFETGRASFQLMQRAGESVADLAHKSYPAGPMIVLCGPGGNGGDGFVAAAHLRDLGRSVCVYLLGSADRLRGDTRRAAELWGGKIGRLSDVRQAAPGVTIDAAFGAGLSRPLTGVLASLAEALHGPIVSVDVPSGLDGLTGRPRSICFKARLTVTFAALRPAHVLSPGKAFCGRVEIVDIDVPVPNHTVFRAIAADEARGARIVEDATALAAMAPAVSGKPANRIAAVRQAAQHMGHPVLLSSPERILGQANGKVIVAPNE
ncbi:MAG: NAD(P)H-hydrate epimerase [Pseudomonadota bacterium]